MKKKKVVTVSAGTGQAIMLSGLQKYSRRLDLAAIVSVSDNGGHTALLRQQYGIPAVGDVRRCLTALASNRRLRREYELRTPLGSSIGNEHIVVHLLETGSLSQAVRVAAAELKLIGTVLPVTNVPVDICARLDDGTEVYGEWQIIDRLPRRPIAEMFIKPDAEALAESVRAIEQADLVVIPPGSLRTGIISCLLTRGIREALQSFAGKVVFVVNIMTHPGQTDGFSAADHVAEFERYAGRRPDVVIQNIGVVPTRLLKHYAAIGSEPVYGLIDLPNIAVVSGNFIPPEDNFMARTERVGAFKKWTHALVHDGASLAAAIMKILDGHT